MCLERVIYFVMKFIAFITNILGSDYTVKELTEFEKDLLLLRIISTSVKDAVTVSGTKRKKVDRKQTRMRSFHYGQKRVCRYTFFFLMSIGPEKFTKSSNVGTILTA